MKILGIIYDKILEWKNESWIWRILPLGGGLYLSSILIYNLKLPVSDPILFGAWTMYFTLILHKYIELKKRKGKRI